MKKWLKEHTIGIIVTAVGTIIAWRVQQNWTNITDAFDSTWDASYSYLVQDFTLAWGLYLLSVLGWGVVLMALAVLTIAWASNSPDPANPNDVLPSAHIMDVDWDLKWDERDEMVWRRRIKAHCPNCSQELVWDWAQYYEDESGNRVRPRRDLVKLECTNCGFEKTMVEYYTQEDVRGEVARRAERMWRNEEWMEDTKSP